MLGHPLAAKAVRLRVLGEVAGVGERLADAAPLDDGDEIEERIGGHGWDVALLSFSLKGRR